MNLSFEDLRVVTEFITVLNGITLRARDGIIPLSEANPVLQADAIAGKGAFMVYDDKHPCTDVDPDLDLTKQIVEYPVLNPPNPKYFHPCLKGLIDRIELSVQMTYDRKPELFASVYGFEKDPYRTLEPQSVIHIAFGDGDTQFLWGSGG